MRFQVLATDYDNTLAEHGRVSDEALAALRRWREAGGRLVLVTGRQLPDLQRVFPEAGFFDGVIAENGALLWIPGGERLLLAEPPSDSFVRRLAEADVEPLSRGEVIVATLRPHLHTVQRVIREMDLSLSVILNKEAVMVLPAGVDKGSGMRQALGRLGIDPRQAIGIGDAENDLPLLASCGMAVAVANALPVLKEGAHWVTPGAQGRGVRDLVEAILEGTLPPCS